MRCFVFASVVALSFIGINATAQEGSEGVASPPLSSTFITADISSTVTITPIAVPPPIIEHINEVSFKPEKQAAKKPKVAPKALSKSLFSRSERQQMALVATKPSHREPLDFPLFDGEEGDSSADEIDMHRSFSRPQVSKVDDRDEEEDPLIHDGVKLRLFLARMKAVQAHQKKYT